MGRACLALAMVMIVTFLSSNADYCRAAILTKGNATYRCKGGRSGECLAISDDLSLEFIFDTDVARMLLFPGQEPATDGSKNPQVQSCSGGPGNPSGTNSNGVCGTPPTTPKDCPKYENNKPCT